MIDRDKEFTTGILYLILSCFVWIGRLICLYTLTQCDFKENYKAEVMYTIGAVTNAGIIIAWFDFGEFDKKIEKTYEIIYPEKENYTQDTTIYIK